MSENLLPAVKRGILRRLTQALMDVQVLKLIREKPSWGYQLQKRIQEKYSVKVGHGQLYPLLGHLERALFVTGKDQATGKMLRIRRVYSITAKGLEYLGLFEIVLREQSVHG